MRECERVQQAEQTLRRCLYEVPFLSITRMEKGARFGDGRVDLLATVRLPGGERRIAVEVKESAQPRQVREAANRLLRLRAYLPDAYFVVAAPYLSPRSAEICERDGIGYVDAAGNCRLSFGQVYIRREGNPNPAPQRRELRSLYAPKAARVLRVLLSAPARQWKMEPLAREAGVSLGQVANVKKLLADREWIRISPEGLSLAEPEALLQEWGSARSRRRLEGHDYYALEAPAEIEPRLAAICQQEGVRCALTGLAAAARYAPAARYQSVSMYLSGEMEYIAGLVGLKPVEGGANVRLLLPEDEGVFYDTAEYDGVPIVSPVQAYLDLQGAGGRSAEAAAALLEEVIRPAWQGRERTITPNRWLLRGQS